MNTFIYRTAIFAFICLVITTICAQGQVERDLKMVNASFTRDGELAIVASKTSSHHDFDFLAGTWSANNRRLKTRLDHCTEWIETAATIENRAMLNGIANMDISRASNGGVISENMSLRIFDVRTRLWNLYWVDGKTGVMDPPVTGSFEGDIGIFYGKNTYNGVPVLVMYKWDKTDPDHPQWSQAYSPDNGLTWEWNSQTLSNRL